MQHLIHNLYAVPVTMDACNEFIEIDHDCVSYYLSYHSKSTEDKIMPLDGNYRIIGYVTAEHISFDPKRYIQILENPEGLYIQHQYFGDYEYKNYMGDKNFLYPQESFRSLLQSKELYFENPLKDAWDEACKWGHGGCTKNEHDEAAKKVVEKLIIIEKI